VPTINRRIRYLFRTEELCIKIKIYKTTKCGTYIIVHTYSTYTYTFWILLIVNIFGYSFIFLIWFEFKPIVWVYIFIYIYICHIQYAKNGFIRILWLIFTLCVHIWTYFNKIRLPDIVPKYFYLEKKPVRIWLPIIFYLDKRGVYIRYNNKQLFF